MSAVVVNEVRRGFYLDSVALMQISAGLAALPDVDDAVAMIGTPSNLEIMREAGLLAPSGEVAGPNDLVLAVRAGDGAAVEAALSHAHGALEREIAPGGGGDWQPRTLDGALERMSDANLVLISTPGAFASREASRALDRGLNVMLFSDNVPLEAERALKQRAHALGLLVMGPDCGTAYVAGTPLAFANVVPRGRVGVIAASGTGLQEVAVLLARAGAGVSHGIGVGGRDLCDAVGGGEHPRRRRSARVRHRHRPSDPRLQTARAADRAPRAGTACGVGKALHGGGVRGGRPRDPTGWTRPGADAEGRGRTRDRSPDCA